MKRIFNTKEIKNAGWIIGGKIAQSALTFVVGILSARYLGPSDYGLINYVGAYTLFLGAFCNLGIYSVIIKEFSDDPSAAGETIGTSAAMRSVAGFLSAIIMVSIVSIADSKETTTIAVAIICSLELIFQSFSNLSQWFQFRYQSKIASIASLIAYAGVSAYKVFLLVTGKSVLWFAFASSINYIIEASFLLIAYRIIRGPRICVSIERGKHILSKSYNYVLSYMMIAIYGQTDKLMLKHFSGESEVGYYSTAYALCTCWGFVITAVIDSVYPTIVTLRKENYAEYEKKNRQLYTFVFYGSTFISAVMALFARIIIKCLYGDAFLPAVKPLRIITWYMAFVFLGSARDAWIVCENRQKYLKYMNLMAAALNVAANLLLIPKLGASGAALASLGTQVCTIIFFAVLIPDMRPNVKLILDAILFRNIK